MFRLSVARLGLLLLVACRATLSGIAVLDDLVGTIQVDQDLGHIGQPVHIVFTIKNQTLLWNGRVQTIECQSKPVIDIRVGYGQEEFASWSAQQPPDKIPHRLVFQPGESKTIELTWVPDESKRGMPVVISGIMNWREDRASQAQVLLYIEYGPG